MISIVIIAVELVITAFIVFQIIKWQQTSITRIKNERTAKNLAQGDYTEVENYNQAMTVLKRLSPEIRKHFQIMQHSISSEYKRIKGVKNNK